MPRIDMLGRQCGKFTVLAPAGKLNKQAAWHCRCECGHETILRGNQLRSASPDYSCQKCMQTVHGHSRRGRSSAEYRAWCSMKSRCTNPNDSVYGYYGARGISVCERWLGSFENFFADVGKRPSPRHSIDRYPNQNGNYEPGNVRWATSREQNRNRRNNKRVIYLGEPVQLTDAYDHSKSTVPYQQVLNRLNLGWTVERALFQPMRTK